MPKAWDALGLTTNSVLASNGTDTTSNVRSRLFTSWQSTANAYSALTLNINAASDGDAGDSAANSCVKYSIDGGLTYATVKCEFGPGYTRQTFTITLSPTQNLSKLRVGVCVWGGRGEPRQQMVPGFDDVALYDIWTSGTNPAPATGNGSTAGQPHRAVVVTN